MVLYINEPEAQGIDYVSNGDEMGISLEWKDKYNVGIDVIDKQHRTFFDMIKTAHSLEDRTMGNSAASELVQEILKYAIYHFQFEEKLMTDNGYPKLHEQKAEHARILKELTTRVIDAKKGNGDITPILAMTITWFIDHTAFADREIGVFLLKREALQ